MPSYEEYYEYLQGRSLLGQIYRNYILYPKLNKSLHGRCLDVGCGIGDFVRFRPDTKGVDINPRTVDFCCGQGLDVALMQINKICEDDESFDCVVLDNVLEHIEDPGPLLGEIWRVLRPGGTFLCGVPGAKGFTQDSDHKVFYNRETLKKTISDMGFNTDSIYGMPLDIDLFQQYIGQYCIFGVFSKNEGF